MIKIMFILSAFILVSCGSSGSVYHTHSYDTGMQKHRHFVCKDGYCFETEE